MKILSLGSKQFLSGVGVSPYYEEAGIFDVAQGIDLFRNIGLLGSGYARASITGNSTQIPRWVFPYPKRGKVYVLGVGSGTLDSPAGRGWIEQRGIDDNSISDTHSKSMSMIRGAILFNNRLLYVNGNFVGNTNVDVAIKDTYSDGWQGNTWTYTGPHPMILGPNNAVYVADGNVLDKIQITSTSTYTTDALTLPVGTVISCGKHDGNYLVLGTSGRPIDFGGVSYNDNTSIIFWDTFSPDFNKKWTINDGPIRKIEVVDGEVRVFVGTNIYTCSYDNSPKLFLGARNITNLSLKPDAEGNSVDSWEGSMLWGESGSKNVWGYGSYNAKIPNILYNPITATAGESISVVKGISNSKIYVGTTGHKLYSFSSGNSSAIATTNLINLNGTYKIEAIKVVTKALASGDSLDVQVQNEAGSNIIEGVFSFARDGNKTSKIIIAQRGTSPIADQIILDLDLTGNVRLKRIDVFGTPVSEEYGN